MPYFGAFPEWMGKYEPPKGYDWLLDTDLNNFKQRVRDKLGIEYPAEYGHPKIHDYRSVLGLLYEEKIKGYDWWVTTDLDVVYGDVNKFFTDEQLNELDVWSNHDSYVCGFWTLYRNCDEVNKLTMRLPDWKEFLIHEKINGWIEVEFSRLLEQSGLRYKYSGDLQGNPYNPPFNLNKEGDKLFQDGIEVPMLHFRRTKKWPL